MFSSYTDIIALSLILIGVRPQYAVGREYSVYTVNEFSSVLKILNPGDQIRLYNAYPGSFVAARNGTTENPIVLFGDTNRVMITANRADQPAIQFIGNHWQVRGFTVINSHSDDAPSVAVSGHDVVLDEMDFRGGKVHILETSAITIQNSFFRVGDAYGVHLYTSTETTGAQGYSFVNNTFVCENEFCDTGIKIDNNRGHYAGGSSIENNTFLTSWYNWIQTTATANEVLIRNNTGSSSRRDGFHVYFSDEAGELPVSKTNIIFELNHCQFVTDYCIKVEPALHDSTCVKPDNTFDSAIALTNVELLCP